MSLARWKLIELAAFLIERDLAREATDVVVRHDVRLPDRGSHAQRQIDVDVEYRVAGEQFRKIVEVQDRSRRVGPGFVGSVADKRDRVRAHRAAIVSVAGFTIPALSRIEEERDRLEAFRLRSIEDRELARYPDWLTWFQKVDIRGLDGPIGTAPLSRWTYEHAVDGRVARYVALSNFSLNHSMNVACVLLEPSESDPDVVRPAVFALGREGATPITGLSLTFEGKNGIEPAVWRAEQSDAIREGQKVLLTGRRVPTS